MLLRRSTNEGSREERKCHLPRTPSSYCIWAARCFTSDPSSPVAVENNTLNSMKEGQAPSAGFWKSWKQLDLHWRRELFVRVFFRLVFQWASWLCKLGPILSSRLRPQQWPFPMPRSLPKSCSPPPQGSLHPRQRWATGCGVQSQDGKGKSSLPFPKYHQGLEWGLWPLRYRQTNTSKGKGAAQESLAPAPKGHQAEVGAFLRGSRRWKGRSVICWSGTVHPSRRKLCPLTYQLCE